MPRPSVTCIPHHRKAFMISLAELQRRIDAGDHSADAAIAQSLEATSAHEKSIGAFVCRDENPRVQSAGPLRGIAVGIKDIMDTQDFPTEMGSPIYRGFRSRGDAAVVMMLKQAGATIIGKTTTTAFASSDPTPTLNPHNHGHTPGGSSSGSAAAVGAGMIPLALGTQTGGSVIRPASFCGAAAIKPSYRLLPTVGVKCYSWTLDTVGLFASGVDDVARGLAAMTGRPGLLLPSNLPTPRIGAAPKGLGSTGDARYNRLWTLMGVPCVNVPTLIAEDNLPVGVTVIARYGADAQALAAARFVEAALARK